MRIPITRFAPVAAVALTLCACSGGGNGASPALPGVSLQNPVVKGHRVPSSGKIQHIVIIVQENRSFNNLFYGFPGAHTAKFGYDEHGNKIKLQPIGLETTWDIDHSFGSFLQACNGTGSYPGTDCQMNGFNNEYVGCGSSLPQRQSPLQLRPAHRNEAATSSWANTTFWPTRCSRPTLMRAASSRTSTSSRAKRVPR